MMKLVFVLVSSYLVTASGRRILGGNDASIQQFPYQVSLQTFNIHFCGGSILSQTKILTAAHCFDDHYGYDYKVRAGSSLRGRGGQLIQVARQHVHPYYNRKTLHNDVAVLILAQPLRFDEYVQPIQLSAETGSYGYITGWGLNERGVNPDRLQMLGVPKLSDERCASYFRDYNRNMMVCYGGEAGRNVCSGDSGGPLVVNGKQVGVASFVADGCREPYVGVYAKVSTFANFINSVN